MLSLIFLTLSFLQTTNTVSAASALSAQALASQYNLSSHTSLPFPLAALAPTDAVDWLSHSSGWQITKKDVSFVSDPFDGSSSTQVLANNYPAGSYSSGTGGASFETYFNASYDTPFRSMLISYELGFSTGFNFAKGGKLPGLRGGDLYKCSGGVFTTPCFSARYMWRTGGQGEAYMCMPDTQSTCSTPGVRCNEDGYGTSLGRGTFTFTTGAWQNISMYVSLNDPVDKANGQVVVYRNGVQAFALSNLQIRSIDSLTGFTGMFLSTFFGGKNESWATPIEKKTYYRNIQLYASTAPSNASGIPPPPSPPPTPSPSATHPGSALPSFKPGKPQDSPPSNSTSHKATDDSSTSSTSGNISRQRAIVFLAAFLNVMGTWVVL